MSHKAPRTWRGPSVRAFAVLAAVSVIVAAASAQTGATGTGAAAGSGSRAGSTGTATMGTTHHKAHKAAANKSYSGTVASVDATAKSFVVHPKKGADITLKVNDKTKYSPKGKSWDDVKADAKVHGKYHNDGTDNWALTVDFAAVNGPCPAGMHPCGSSCCPNR